MARSSRRGPRASTIIGGILLLVGLGVLGWAGWQFFGTNITSRQAATRQVDELRDSWARDGQPGKVADGKQVPGQAIALMRIPQLGGEWPVLAGTDADTLSKGIGWYEGTAAPGEVGNFAVAGHRITRGEPFRHLLELDKGAEVVVETREVIFTYELDSGASQLTVADVDGGWVLDPVPGKPTAKPSRAILTLTTCQDLFHSPDRSVAFAHLVKTEKK